MSTASQTVLVAFSILLTFSSLRSPAQNVQPVADAGSARYAGTAVVTLDGAGSYDPDNSGPLSYSWQQVGGPPVTITDANTAKPTVSGFSQTSSIQECEFELTVSDGELTSPADTVRVIIVPAWGDVVLTLKREPFDPDKPTIVFFHAGDCTNGTALGTIFDSSEDWIDKANIIYFEGYSPDSGSYPYTYYRYGDRIIAYLSYVAPDYRQAIQTCGLGTGGQPAIDAGLRLNLTYRDARYAVNRVTFLDATGYCRDYSESIPGFLASSVDGEQCSIDSYISTIDYYGSPHSVPFVFNDILNVWFEIAYHYELDWATKHWLAPDWYAKSVSGADMNLFNDGVVAGSYWSVVGPGKNLQLGSTGAQTYTFEWYGWADSGYMDFYDEPCSPGRLAEPITLIGPNYVEEAGGFLLTCEPSQNAVGYELLFGSDPYRVMDYEVVSDTLAPPNDVIDVLPFEVSYWTVRVRDEYGSTIYADPESIDPSLNRMADFDRDGKVNFKDFAIFTGPAKQSKSVVDIFPPPSGDGAGDFRDMAFFAQYWLADRRKEYLGHD